MELDATVIKSFCDDLAAQRWDKVEAFLTTLLDQTPREALDAVDLGGLAPKTLWINALLRTGLYKASPSGRYLFLKLARELWLGAPDEERWLVLCCVACLHEERSGDSTSGEALAAYLHGLAGLLGVSQEEVSRVVVRHYGRATVSTPPTTAVQ